jgi:hypothetical protein
MLRSVLTSAIIGSLWLATVPESAHHPAISQFAVDNPMTLRGTVTKVEWVNPHGWVHVDVRAQDGDVETWAIETGSPYTMAKRGLDKLDFRSGVEVVVTGWPAKDGTRTMAAETVTFPERAAYDPPREASFSLGR